MTRSRTRMPCVGVDEELVRRLISTQFPQWAGLPVQQVRSPSTDNLSFRLGESLVVRVPSKEFSSRHVLKEARWLPHLAPLLPLAIPKPVALGRRGEQLPWRWLVLEWIDADPLALESVDVASVTVAIAEWVRALHRVEPTGGPAAGAQNGCRGTGLSKRSHHVDRSIKVASEFIDADDLAAAWRASLDTPRWTGSPVWIHGDLHPGNLLARDGQLHAVIDFGCLAVGDPAVDLMVAWNLPDDHREQFQSIVDVDDATWLRGRGSALFQWVGGLDPNNPDNEAARVINRILADHKRRSNT